AALLKSQSNLESRPFDGGLDQSRALWFARTNAAIRPRVFARNRGGSVSRTNYGFTNESGSEGHPHKLCGRISDAVGDLYLAADPHSRVAIETLVTTNRIVMAGEVRGPESVTPELIEQAARRAVREIGYEQKGFHWDLAEFEYYVHEQSADIARGVDADAETK